MLKHSILSVVPCHNKVVALADVINLSASLFRPHKLINNSSNSHGHENVIAWINVCFFQNIDILVYVELVVIYFCPLFVYKKRKFLSKTHTI